ncbi:MAG: hypothetical protein J6W49_01910 [Paludibacteraceae bacterium]|nr:hypothetical protein [Paludibacteraceae bacterium]
MRKYLIYPSLLDAYQRMIDSDLIAEESWNITPEGGYRKTPDEIFADNRQALLDSINRVKGEPSEAADRGTVFNEIVDMAIAGRATPSRDDITDVASNVLFCQGTMNGKEYMFETGLILQAREYFSGAISQVRVQADINVDDAVVTLYGYADEVMPDRVCDIKTTTRYEFGKYAKHWQRHVYPYCLTKSGDCKDIQSFEFNVYKLYDSKKVCFCVGEVFKEEYSFNYSQSESEIRNILRSFIGWIERNREFITDRKIFGLSD